MTVNETALNSLEWIKIMLHAFKFFHWQFRLIKEKIMLNKIYIQLSIWVFEMLRYSARDCRNLKNICKSFDVIGNYSLSVLLDSKRNWLEKNTMHLQFLFVDVSLWKNERRLRKKSWEYFVWRNNGWDCSHFKIPTRSKPPNYPNQDKIDAEVWIWKAWA